MKMIRIIASNCSQRLSAFLAKLCLLTSVLICATATATPIKIAVSQTPLSLPFYIAKHQGFFENRDVSVEFQNVIGGHRAFKALQDGEVDLATASEAVVMFNSFKADNFSILTTFVNSEDDIKLLVDKSLNISSLSQLVGKKIGTVKGSASHYFLNTLLLMKGIDPNKINIVAIKPEEMLAALAAKTVDGVAIWEPFAFEIIKDNAEIVILSEPGEYRLTFNLLQNTQVKPIPERSLIKILTALNDAENYIKENPEGAQQILKEQLQLDQDFINWIWPSYHYRLFLDQTLLMTLESEARWARREGYAENKSINYLNYINATPLKKVKPSSVSIME